MKFGHTIEKTYTGGTTQETIELDVDIGYMGYTLQLNPIGGTAKVQASLNGTDWIDWDDGLISAPKASIMAPMRYVRVVHGTATASTFIIWGRMV